VIFVDTNVVIDIFRRDARWFDWSADRLAMVTEQGEVAASAVVIAELSWSFDRLEDLLATLDRLSLVPRPLPAAAAFLAGKRFQSFRRTRYEDDHPRVLPDFLIGAHAFFEGASLLTRDPKLYRRYFPDLTLITPETHP